MTKNGSFIVRMSIIFLSDPDSRLPGFGSSLFDLKPGSGLDPAKKLFYYFSKNMLNSSTGTGIVTGVEEWIIQ